MFLSPGSRAGRKRVNSVGAPLALNFGTITANPGEPTPGMALSIFGTFNNGAVTFDAPLFMNITTTAFANGSNFLDFQAGGTSFFNIPTPTASALDLINFVSGTTNANGFRLNNTSSGGEWFIEVGGSGADWTHGLIFYDNFAGRRALLLNAQNGAGLMTGSTQGYAWSSATTPTGGSADTELIRLAAGVVALNRGANNTTTGVISTAVWQQHHDNYGGI